MFMIALSAFINGAETEIAVTDAFAQVLVSDENQEWNDRTKVFIDVCGAVSFAWLVGEVFIRACAHGRRYLWGPDRVWNIFDIFLVVYSLVEYFTWNTSLQFLRIMRMVRLAKAAKFFRMM